MTVVSITDNSPAINGSPTTTYTGSQSNSLDSDADANINRESDADMGVDKYQTGTEYKNGILRFTGLSNIAAGSTINSATLYLKVNTFDGTPVNLSIWRCLRNWINTECTWTNYHTTPSNAAWSTGGATGSGTDVASTAVATPTGIALSVGGWISITVTSAVTEWVTNSVANNGFVIECTSPVNTGKYINFASVHAANNSKPELLVDWSVAAGGGARFTTQYRHRR